MPELATEDDPHPVARLQALSSSAVERFLNSCYVEGPDGKIRYNRQDYAAKLLVLTWVDEHGQRIFEDGHVPALSQQESVLVQRLAVVAERLNGLQVKPPETAAGN